MKPEQNPYYIQALEYIKNNDLAALEPGKHVIDGDNLFVNVSVTPLKTPEEAKLEVHNVYIDIQVPISKAESYGVKPRSECKEPVGEFDEEKDVLFYNDHDWETVSRQPGETIVFDTDTAHAPMIGEGEIKKAIFKVKKV